MNNLSIRKMNEISKKKKKGFTLVELIIVIAIIAILAAIAIPKFGTVRTTANKKADIANAKTVATAVSNAIANGDADVTTTGYLKYIDGGVELTTKAITPAVTITPVVDAKTNDITVIAGASGDQLYPKPSGIYATN